MEKTRILLRIEQGVTSVLAVLITIMVLTALWGLLLDVYHLVLHGALNDLSHSAFQSAFGTILTLVIALEFSHTFMHQADHSGIAKTRAVVMIAILAVARQFIVFEFQSDSAAVLGALAISLLVLGIVHRLIREDQG